MMVDFAQYRKSTYDWKPGHEKYLRITKSSLTSDFDFCPQQYYFKRVEGRKQPQTEDMLRGINVHDAMELYFINVKPSMSKILALAKEGKDEEGFGLMWKCLPEPEEPYTLGEEDILLTRMQWEYARLIETDGVNYLPIMNEEEVHTFYDHSYTLNDETFTVPIHLTGMIDRGFQTEDGAVALMELKTGKWKTDERAVSMKNRSMRTEMAFYTSLLKKADHEYKQVTHWGWLYPGGDRLGLPDTAAHWDYEPVKKVYLNNMEKRIDNLIEAYFTENFPAKATENKCKNWCPWIADCPAWQEGGEMYNKLGETYWRHVLEEAAEA